jgi:UDP-3-O-[3-hydroxymyristoyl] glucosamine N-acyltransferase
VIEIIGSGAYESIKTVSDLELDLTFSRELQLILKNDYFDEVIEIPQILGLGLVGQDPGYKFLTFVEDHKYVKSVLEADDISCVITTPALQSLFDDSSIHIVIRENPKFEYFGTYNKLAHIRLQNRRENQISVETKISPSASISAHNVKIHPGVIIESHVTIYPNVEIKSGSVIRAGAVVGSPGFEYKRHKNEVLPVLHDGNTILGEHVEIGPGTVIGQGFFRKPTIIGSDAKTDNLVSVAHGSVIGDRVLIAAGSIVSGSTIVGQDSWIGPGSVLSNGLNIGAGAFIALGSHVFKDVEAGDRVIGSPARPLPR